jgi:hypothetical protein
MTAEALNEQMKSTANAASRSGYLGAFHRLKPTSKHHPETMRQFSAVRHRSSG